MRPAGSAAAAAAAHTLPTGEAGARRLSMPSAPAGSLPSASPQRRGWERAAQAGSAARAGEWVGQGIPAPPPTASLRSAEPTHPQVSGIAPGTAFRFGGSVAEHCFSEILGDPLPKRLVRFSKEYGRSEVFMGAPGLPRGMKKGHRTS